MKIKMELMSDAIFGNGMSIPGGEDISVLIDENGFPYYKGSTFKGVFRDESIKYLQWCGKTDKEIAEKIELWFGMNGDDRIINDNKLVFSDFKLSGNVRQMIKNEIKNPTYILDSLSNLRTFTAIENEVVKDGSLRIARCIDRGLVFYSDVHCDTSDETLIEEILGMIKWIGSMKSRGFGKVCISKVEEDR